MTGNLNFGDLFDAVARVVPERPAIVQGDTRITWRRFDRRSNRLARYLMGLGCRPDAKVAFFLRNTPAYVELFSACVKARLVHANVNYRYVGPELLHVLDDSDAEVVVYDADRRDQIDALRDRLHGVKGFLEVGDEAPAGFASSFEAACREGDPAPLDIERSGDDLYFMYTGGTTGYPKAVMWPHHQRIRAIGMTDAEDAGEHARAVAASPGPTALAACPLMHSTGLTTMVSVLVNGGCLSLLPGRSFDAETCLREIERHGVTRVAIVGDAFSVPILDYLDEHPDAFDLSGVELITSAGTMWSEPNKQRLLEYFRNATLSDSLGSSEGSRLASSTRQRGESGETAKFVLGDGVKVFTEDFREVVPGSGEAGMIARTGPIPLGYYNDPERTAKTFPTIDGVRYSIPGDWCTVDADGTITLLGRGSNCINTGGEKVFPEEVEEALKTMDGIEDVAVLGAPDERWGEAVVAVVRLRGEALGEAEIREHLDALLARYKNPKRYLFVSRDLRHANGKMNYPAARRLWKETESREGAGPR